MRFAPPLFQRHDRSAKLRDVRRPDNWPPPPTADVYTASIAARNSVRWTRLTGVTRGVMVGSVHGFALFAEVERDLISERTREAKARASGRKARAPERLAGRLTARTGCCTSWVTACKRTERRWRESSIRTGTRSSTTSTAGCGLFSGGGSRCCRWTRRKRSSSAPSRTRLPRRLRPRCAGPRERELRAGRRRAAPGKRPAGRGQQRVPRPGHAGVVGKVRGVATPLDWPVGADEETAERFCGASSRRSRRYEPAITASRRPRSNGDLAGLDTASALAHLLQILRLLTLVQGVSAPIRRKADTPVSVLMATSRSRRRSRARVDRPPFLPFPGAASAGTCPPSRLLPRRCSVRRRSRKDPDAQNNLGAMYADGRWVGTGARPSGETRAGRTTLERLR